MSIDINCDVGEGVKNEHLIMPYISSCNIACGGHFGDEKSIDKTIELAIKNNLKIGAHPSFSDKNNFGRKILTISEEDLKQSIEQQLELFLERLVKFNQKMHHIKPHGALYNLIAKDKIEAEKFIRITEKYLVDCFLYVPYNSEIEKVALNNDIKIKYESFADRNYKDDLTLVSRNQTSALITKSDEVFNHVFLMIKNGRVKTISGIEIAIKTDTFCIHGDTESVVEIVSFLVDKLKKEGILIG